MNNSQYSQLLTQVVQNNDEVAYELSSLLAQIKRLEESKVTAYEEGYEAGFKDGKSKGKQEARDEVNLSYRRELIRKQSLEEC